MKPLVLVTRPEGAGAALAAGIEARGYDVLTIPVLRVAPISTPLPALADYDALAFTSANGVRAFSARSEERDLPAYVVGAATAAAADDAGFRDIRLGGLDAMALAGRLRADFSTRATVLHLSGRHIAQDLARLFAGSPVTVERLAVYETVPEDSLAPDTVDRLYACTIAYVTLLSARTAEGFGTLLARSGLAYKIEAATALCLSAAVAEAAAGLPWKSIATAPYPTVEALLDLLP
jgi:uroporphyrinogen-III synthase